MDLQPDCDPRRLIDVPLTMLPVHPRPMARQDKDQPPNREQRRAAQFGKHRPDPLEPWPQQDENPALRDAVAGTPDQDQTEATGPGTGGATKSKGRAPHNEGAHPGTKPKG